MDRIASIKARLELLAQRDRALQVFGSDSHRYRMNPILTEQQALVFEAANGIRLPEEYRAYLTQVAQGGAGPFCGLMPLNDNDGNLVFSNLPFPFTQKAPLSLRDIYKMMEEATASCADEYEVEALDELIWYKEVIQKVGRGITYLAHEGCGMYSVLVINGEEYGHVWYVDLANDLGVFPLVHPHTGEALGFFDWLELWLDAAIAQASGSGQELSGYVGFIYRHSEDGGPGLVNTLHLYNANELDSLQKTLVGGGALSSHDIERLAFTLSDHAVFHIAEDEDSEAAREELELVFLCQERLPASRVVQDAFFEAALACIDDAGDLQEFTVAEAYLQRLLSLLDKDPSNRLMARACANGIVLLIIQYLDNETGEEREDKKKRFSLFSARKEASPSEHSREQYRTLENLAGRYPDDPVMTFMLAWAQRCYVHDAASGHQQSVCAARLQGLANFAAQHADNALVAAEYAHACYDCFLEYKEYDEDGEQQMLFELERLAKDYGAAYRDWAKKEPDYELPAYEPDKLDGYFISALSSLAEESAQNGDPDVLWSYHHRLWSMTIYPDMIDMHQIVGGQLLSNISFVYGNLGDFDKSEEMVGRLRVLAQQPVSEKARQSLTNDLSDTLYNLVTDYAEKDWGRYSARMNTLTFELEGLASQTIDPASGSRWDRLRSNQRTRYASALFNIYSLGPSRYSTDPLWEKLYAYVCQYRDDMSTLMIETIATEESSFIEAAGKVDGMERALYHRERVMAVTTGKHPPEVHAAAAAADFNLLVTASNKNDIRLAQEMMDSLAHRAAEHPHNSGVVLRLAKGAVNLILDYEDANNFEKAEAVYRLLFQATLPHRDDPEIVNRLVSAAFNLGVDYKKAGNLLRIAQLYADVCTTKPTGDAAAHLEKLRTWAA